MGLRMPLAPGSTKNNESNSDANTLRNIETEPECDTLLQTFVELFFSRSTVTQTLQCMLVNVGSTLDDLCHMASILHNDSITFAMCNAGVMPIAHNFAYLIPYEYMSKQQLRFVRKCCREMQACEYTMNASYIEGLLYMSKLEHTKIDDAVLLFGVSNFVNKSLRCERSQKEQYINSSLFYIINSCKMHQSSIRKASRWFGEEN